MKGYEAFVVELKENIDDCINRNIHNRTRQEIENVNKIYTCTCIVESLIKDTPE